MSFLKLLPVQHILMKIMEEENIHWNRNRIGGYNDPEFAILLSYTVPIIPVYLTQGRTKVCDTPPSPNPTCGISLAIMLLFAIPITF